MKTFLDVYLSYIKNNPEHYWFKRKLYGWGWTPATKEGWGVLVLFMILIVLNTLRVQTIAYREGDVLFPFFLQTSLLVFALLAICYKTGEKPKWQWGLPKDALDETNTQK